MAQIHHIRFLDECQAVSRRRRVWRHQFIGRRARQHQRAVLEHAHVAAAEFEDVGLFGVELERDQPCLRRACLHFPNEFQTGTVRRAAVGMDEQVHRRLQAGRILRQIDARPQRRRQDAASE